MIVQQSLDLSCHPAISLPTPQGTARCFQSALPDRFLPVISHLPAHLSTSHGPVERALFSTRALLFFISCRRSSRPVITLANMPLASLVFPNTGVRPRDDDAN